MKTINPYLTFNGNCEEAYNFYKTVFGGEFMHLGRFKEMPPNPECKVPEDYLEKIMHVSLPINDQCVLMGCDSSDVFRHATVQGNNFALSVNNDDLDEATRIFNGLSSGGKVTMPMNKTFWSSHFGMFTDQFGIPWMVNCDAKQ